MASTLRILPEIETKSLVCEGIIAVREAVALTVVMPPGAMDDGDDIHVRIRGRYGDVARFPLEDEDAWAVSSDEEGNTILSATLNCNTDVMAKCFRYIPEAGKLPFFVTVENETKKTLCARGRIKVLNWCGDGNLENPVIIENEKISAAEIRKAVDGIPTDYANQREIGSALSQTVEALKGIGLCLALIFALTARAIEWQDVPSETVIGQGLSITNGEIRATASNDRFVTDIDGAGHSITNSPMATTNFVLEVVGSVTNNLPSGGRDGQAVTNIVESLAPVYDDDGYVPRLKVRDHLDVQGGIDSLHLTDSGENGKPTLYGDTWEYRPRVGLKGDREVAVKGDLSALVASTNLPPLSASSTVGDLVDTLNAIANALRPKEDVP